LAPLLCYDAQIEEIDYSILVDISSRDGSQVGVGLVLTYGPNVYEVPVLKGGLLHHFSSGAAVGVVAAGSTLFLDATHVGLAIPYTEMENITLTKLALISQRARKDPKFQFTSLAHLLSEGFLKECYYRLGRGACHEV
jgi:hypothetical protein